MKGANGNENHADIDSNDLESNSAGEVHDHIDVPFMLMVTTGNILRLRTPMLDPCKETLH